MQVYKKSPMITFRNCRSVGARKSMDSDHIKQRDILAGIGFYKKQSR